MPSSSTSRRRREQRLKSMEPLALTVPCSTCAARRGNPCRVQGSFENGGELVGYPHGYRVQRAQKEQHDTE